MSCPFHSIENIHELDALNPEARSNPYPYYDWLRDDPERAVYKVPYEKDFYMIHRYDDVKEVFSDTIRFSSKIIPTRISPFVALMDEPDHKRIRSVISLIFSQKNIQKWEPVLHKVVENATSELMNSHESELFDKWANVIPLGTLAALFGLPGDRESLQKLHKDAIAINRALFVTGGTGPRRNQNPNWSEKFSISWALIKNRSKIIRLKKLIGNSGMKELGAMLKITNKKVTTPRPDFKSIPAAIAPLLNLMILFAERIRSENLENDATGENPLATFNHYIKSEQVTFTEMMMAGAFILFAGYETTSSLLSNCFVHLARNPELFKELKLHPEKLEDFMEESLRLYTPVTRFLRRTKTDVTISGKIIPKDSIVILMSGAANTDPDKFKNGCAFDINRDNSRQHLSFGKGAHFCIGAPLARVQVMMALSSLINRAEKLELVNEKDLKMVTDRDNGIFRYEKIVCSLKGQVERDK